MKKALQIITICLLGFNTLSAQWVADSVSMGPGYSNNIFYSLSGGVQKTSPSKNWHIAFSMNALDSASVYANHNSGNVFVQVYNIHKPISDWNTATLGDTATADLLYSGNQGWYQGAFNQIQNPSAFNYGWGTYNLSTHLIQGDSMFLVKTGGVFYKFAIDSLNPIAYNWHIRVQKMDLVAITQTYTISKSSGYSNRLFAYFNLDSASASDREPDVNNWDMQFITYPALVPQGPPPTPMAWYGVTGALNNRLTMVAKAQQIHVDTAFANSTTYTTGWSSVPYTTIGYDWKTFNMGTNMYDIADSVSYFVCSTNDTIYQMQFLGFGGGANGNINFRKQVVGPCPAPVGIKEVSTIGEMKMYPNPANNQTNILFNAKHNDAVKLIIFSLNGQAVYKSDRKVKAGLNAWQLSVEQLPVGNYVIQINNGQQTVQQKMTINR